MEFKSYVKQNDIWEKRASQLHEAQKMKNYYTKLSESLSKDLLKMSAENISMSNNFKFDFSYRAGSIDYKAIPELKYVDLNKYRKEDLRVWKLEYLGTTVINKMDD